MSEAEKMLFIAQKKVTGYICNNKDILANINLNLKIVCDHFVHLVASLNLPSHVMMIERSVSFERIWNTCRWNFPFANNWFTGRPRLVDFVHKSPIYSLIAPVPCSPSINKSFAYHFGPVRVRILPAQNRVMAEAQVPIQGAVPAAQALV